MPCEHAGSNVFPLDRPQRVVELLVEVAGETFVNKRIEKLADMARQCSSKRLTQSLFVNCVVDVLGSVAFRVLEVSINHPIVRKLEGHPCDVADGANNYVRIPRTHLWQIHTGEVRKYRCAGSIERIRRRDFERRKSINVT